MSRINAAPTLATFGQDMFNGETYCCFEGRGNSGGPWPCHGRGVAALRRHSAPPPAPGRPARQLTPLLPPPAPAPPADALGSTGALVSSTPQGDIVELTYGGCPAKCKAEGAA